MHGRVKTRTTEEQKEMARQEKCKKAQAYKETVEKILEIRSSSNCDQEALDLTANVLIGNPDIITLWNYRREIFLKLKNKEDVDSYQKLLEKDISLTEQCLRVNPKSYASWHHRTWILDNLPHPDWEKELKLCTKYLQLDERNFHCWDYRRIVTQRSNISDESEYEYTLQKIENNFSNYSAWHLRSKLLPKIFADPAGIFPINEEKHKEELELVENAAFTDPNDQSAWFYLRWLLGLTEPKASFVWVEARENEVFVVISKNVMLSENTELGVSVNVKINDEIASGHWESVSRPSGLWTFKLDSKTKATDAFVITLEENGVEYSSILLLQNETFENQPNFNPAFSDSLKETLTNQLSSCKQLLELEPDSKWPLLTSVLLMLSIDSPKYETQINQGLDKLSLIDPFRRNYYLDLKGKIITESALKCVSIRSKNFSLTCKNLTALYHSQYFVNFEEVDLSNNDLSSTSLRQFYALINCKVLNLNNNKIQCVGPFPILQKLETLLLDNNLIHKVTIDWVRAFPQLNSLSIRNNPVSQNLGLMTSLCATLCRMDIEFCDF